MLAGAGNGQRLGPNGGWKRPGERMAKLALDREAIAGGQSAAEDVEKGEHGDIVP